MRQFWINVEETRGGMWIWRVDFNDGQRGVLGGGCENTMDSALAKASAVALAWRSGN